MRLPAAILLALLAASLAAAQAEPLVVLPNGWQISESSERFLLARHAATGVMLGAAFSLEEDPTDPIRDLSQKVGRTEWANRRSGNDPRSLFSLQSKQLEDNPWASCLVFGSSSTAAQAMQKSGKILRACESTISIAHRYGQLYLVACVEGELPIARKALATACAPLRPHPRCHNLGANPQKPERDAYDLGRMRDQRPDLDPLPAVYEPGRELRLLRPEIPDAYMGGMYDAGFRAIRDRYERNRFLWLTGTGSAEPKPAVVERVVGVFPTGAPAETRPHRIIISYRREADGSGRATEMLTLLDGDAVLRHGLHDAGVFNPRLYRLIRDGEAAPER